MGISGIDHELDTIFVVEYTHFYWPTFLAILWPVLIHILTQKLIVHLITRCDCDIIVHCPRWGLILIILPTRKLLQFIVKLRTQVNILASSTAV